MASMVEARGPVLLDGYAAKRCAVRIQNDFHPLVPKIPWQPSPEVQARLDAGNAFEGRVVELLLSLGNGAVLIDPDLRSAEAIAATTAAMDAGVPLILGGRLPDDISGGRTGKPDILIRWGEGYLPGDVKWHVTMDRKAKACAMVSRLEAPVDRIELPGWSSATSKRFDDGLQLAHYTRMLQACGRHGGPLLGAIIGTREVEVAPGEQPALVFTWHDLDEPTRKTYSRSEGSKKRSLLECYDHEHGFRRRVVETVLRITGGADDPEPLVAPVGQEDCESCPYNEWCAEQMGDDDPSALLTRGRLSPREYLALRRMGIDTTASLSAVDTDDPGFFDTYFAEVSNFGRKEARTRLDGAIRRAQMICDGIEIVRDGAGPVEVPSADVEIDVDIENDANNLVYMWGIRIREGHDESTARYMSDFTAWEPLDHTAERELARRFVAWLREQCATAAQAGRTVRVFHWSGHEVSNLRRILGLEEVGDLIHRETGVFTDLMRVFESNFFSLHGSKLKRVARLFGFEWAVDDPGGGVSQLRLATVHTGPPDAAAAAREWLLTYNEGDTTATAVVRDGMRNWPVGPSA